MIYKLRAYDHFGGHSFYYLILCDHLKVCPISMIITNELFRRFTSIYHAQLSLAWRQQARRNKYYMLTCRVIAHLQSQLKVFRFISISRFSLE